MATRTKARATPAPSGWLILSSTHPAAVDVDAAADFFMARLADTPIGPLTWRISKAGRGDAFQGVGAPTRADLAVPELIHGLMIHGDRGFISWLGYARTRRVDKNWARLRPECVEGGEIMIHRKALSDDDVASAHASALALLPVLTGLGATSATLEWRAGGENHETDFPLPVPAP